MSEHLANPNENNATKLKALREDYRKTFETPEGKRVLADLATTCFYNTTTFVPNDSMAVVFNEGNRAVYLHIKTIMEMDIETLERLNAKQ